MTSNISLMQLDFKLQRPIIREVILGHKAVPQALPMFVDCSSSLHHLYVHMRKWPMSAAAI